MAILLENVGLDVLNHDDEALKHFIMTSMVHADKEVFGYSGLKQTYYKMGPIEVWCRTQKQKKGLWGFNGFDVHCVGSCVWDMVCSEFDISDEDEAPFKRTLFCHAPAEKDNLGVPIEIINADVLPSLAPGEPVKMQVIAFPLEFHYFENEEAYHKSLPVDEDGHTFGPAEGTFFPFHFFINHAPNCTIPEEEKAPDTVLEFFVKVEKLRTGVLEGEDGPVHMFIQCYAQTKYGPIEFVHSLTQVPKEEQQWVKPGCILAGTCVLSGDVAIFEHGTGIVKDFNHNLHLLRDVFEGGSPERLRPVLAPDATYEKDFAQRTYNGPSEIISAIENAHKLQKKSDLSYRVRYAHIISLEDATPEFSEKLPESVQFIGKDTEFSTLVMEKPKWDYPIGTRVLILFASDHEDPETICFLEVNEDGMITHFHTSKDSRYHFQYD